MTRRGVFGAGAAALFGIGGCAPTEIQAERRWPPEGRFVEAEGLKLHYVEAGPADGPPVALIHGASGNLRDFTFSLTDRLAREGLRTLAFDRPGLGYSERPAERGWDPSVQAAAIRAGARALGVEQAIVVGHSWGGAAAMAWALDAPETVTGVVSLAGATYPWGGDAGLLYSLGASPVWSGLARRLAAAMVDEDDPEGVLKRIFRPDPVPAGYAEHIGVGLALRPETFRANAEDLDRLHEAVARLAPRYGTLPMPVTAIHGGADRTVWASVHAEPLARDAPRGRLVILPNAGHMPHHAEENAVVAEILRLAGAA